MQSLAMHRQHMNRSPYLLCTLALLRVLQVGALQSRADDGQAFACLELVGQREQTRLLHILLCICANQDQQLGPGERGGSRDGVGKVRRKCREKEEEVERGKNRKEEGKESN